MAKLFGSNIQVNSTIKNHQTDAKLYALKDGGFVAVWEDSSETGGDTGGAAIRGQIFNADGSKRGGEFLVNTTTKGSQNDPHVTVLSDGRFVVVWEDYSQDVGTVRGRVYQPDGTPAGNDFEIAGPAASYSWYHSVTALSDGGFAVSYGTSGYDIEVQSFNAALQPVGTAVQVNSTSGDTYQNPVIVPLQGRHMVFFENQTGDDTIRYRILNNDGSAPAGSAEFVISIPNGEVGTPVAAPLSNGSVIIAWSEYTKDADDNWNTTIKAQILNPDGSKSGSEISVKSDTKDVWHQISSVTHLADGGFAISYFTEEDGTNSEDLYLATFDASGNRTSADLLVERVYNGEDATLTTLADGRVVVSWDTWVNDFDNRQAGIEAQIIDPRQKSVALSGTAADDQYVGTDFGDWLSGAAGGDRLQGGSGDDTLDGGSGIDVMLGGDGNDRFFVDASADTVVETAGGGADTVVAAASYTLSSAHEIENLAAAAGTANLSLTGNALANVITGNSGRNTVDGGSGNDKLYGGLGNDRLKGGSGKDAFVFDSKPSKASNLDKILDFKVSDDSVWLDNKVFTKLGSGSPTKPKKLGTDMFVKASQAQDAEDRVIYDSKSGALYYDADGTGKAAQVKIATLSKNLKLAHDDFFVI
jgi:Ca2+-binding RTX toxin-like protein